MHGTTLSTHMTSFYGRRRHVHDTRFHVALERGDYFEWSEVQILQVTHQLGTLSTAMVSGLILSMLSPPPFVVFFIQFCTVVNRSP